MLNLVNIRATDMKVKKKIMISGAYFASQSLFLLKKLLQPPWWVICWGPSQTNMYILRKGFVVWDTSAAQQYLYQKVAAYAICHIAILIIFGLIVQL